MDNSIITTYNLIAPFIDGASEWKFFQDLYNPVYESQPRCVDSTYGVGEGKYGGYDGWLIVQYPHPVLRHREYSYSVYRVVGSFIFEVEF